MMTIRQRLVRKAAAGLLCLLILITGEQCRAGWQPIPNVPATEQLRDIDGFSPDSIFAVGNAGTILQYNGAVWQDISGITQQTIFGVWWASKNKAFAVADKGGILHFDGAAWTAMDSGTTLRLRDVWGAAEDCVFAVGETGTILRYDGNSWEKMPSPTSLTLQSVWGASRTSVYAVGGTSGSGGTGSGIILYYDGTHWTVKSATVTPRLLNVFGVGNSVYAAGETGAILVSGDRGTTWTGMHCSTAETLRGIWGSSVTNLYAVGDYGTVAHYDGTAWTLQSSGTNEDLFAVWGTSWGGLYAVGRSGTVLQYQDNATDNSTPSCPFKEAIAGPSDLHLLRSARDQNLNTPAGLLLTALFYATAPETASIIHDEPELQKKLQQLVAQNRAALQDMAQGQPGLIGSSTIHETISFLKALQSRGSWSLGFILSGAIRALERGWLPVLLPGAIKQ